ncbi:MAG: N-acetylmuramoyl-L-alanine amidase [Cyanobacteria bacterium]|nr:N-acetylmuramoyl-L-alanine amidase [Cyanobacteriota bacterium]
MNFRRGVVAASAVLMLVIGLSFLASAQTPPLTVIAREGRKPLPVTSINNQDYIAVDDINAAFATTSREDRLAGGLTMTARGRSIVLTENQNVVSVAGRLVTLPAPPVRRDGRWYVPADFLPRALSSALDVRLDLRRSARLLIVGDLRVPRVVSRVDAGANNVAVTLDITPNTEARVNAQQGRLVVQFDADALDLSIPLVSTQGFVQTIAPGDTPQTVVITLGPRYATHRVTASQPDPASGRVTIDLMPATTDVAPVPAPPSPAPDTRLVIPTQGPSTGLRTVVIDPGHGGDELGTQGPKGTVEKEITLSVARRLRTLIESRLGLKVFLTREDDRTMSLDDRSAFANNHHADVFLSIHANYAVRPALKGAEVYYLTVERADEEARKKAAENATTLPALGGGSRAIDLILWETAQARYLEQSASLAGFIEQSLRPRVEMSPRPVQQLPLRVLVGANMPAALVEIGYLSNTDQETQLGTAAYQDQIALALLDALTKFREFLEH